MKHRCLASTSDYFLDFKINECEKKIIKLNLPEVTCSHLIGDLNVH